MALDKIPNKIDRIVENARTLQLRSIKTFCFNSTQAVSGEAAAETEGTAETHGGLILTFVCE